MRNERYTDVHNTTLGHSINHMESATDWRLDACGMYQYYMAHYAPSAPPMDVALVQLRHDEYKARTHAARGTKGTNDE